MSETWKQSYRRLLEAEDLIARAAYRRGISNEVVQAALDAAEERLSSEEEREDLYLASLRHFVSALGARLEVRVLFDDQAVVIRRDPSPR